MTDPQKEFGERVKQIVAKFGSAAKLASVIGVSSRIIEKYVAGESDPSRKILLAMADAAGVDVAWLSSGRGAMSEKTESVGYPKTFKPILDAVTEVMSSGDEEAKLALSQNAYSFQERIRYRKEVEKLKVDMDILKKKVFEEPREDNLMGQGTQRKRPHQKAKQRAGGKSSK